MIKDDWLMNLIEQTAKTVRTIVGYADEGELAAAQASIEETAQEYTGLTWPQITQMPADDLTAYVGRNEQNGIGHLLLLTELLYLAGDIANASDDPTSAYVYHLKALDIRLQMAIGFDLSNAHLDANIHVLANLLSDKYVLPTSTMQALFTYYERTTHFDLAEDVLFELIDEHITTEDMVAAGLAFYERLMQHNDTMLATGNFTRAEVDDGFDELWKRSQSTTN